MSLVKDWSATAASNNSTAPDGAPEGQTPGSLNNSIRNNMAAVRDFYEGLEWRDWGHTVTYATATTFTIPDDVTDVYVAERRVKCNDSSTLYGKVASSSYSSPNTTVTVTLDSGSLSASLSSVEVGFDPSNTPYAAATSSLSGIVEFATTAETLTGTDTDRAITPAGFAGSKSLASDGYYKLPGGLIIEWGQDTTSASSSVAVSFSGGFSAAPKLSFAPAGTSGYFATFDSATSSGFNLSGWSGTSTRVAANIQWIAIGY